MNDYYPFIVLAHHILCIILATFSIIFSTKVLFYRRLLTKSTKVSSVLNLYFAFIFLWGILSLLNRIYSIFYWRPVGNEYNAKILYWFGFIIFILGYIGTALEIFLCIDRCLSVLYSVKYSSKLQKYLICVALIALILFIGILLFFNDILSLIPKTTSTTCMMFGCLIRHMSTNNLYQTKFTVIGINVFGGIILLVLIKTKLSSSDEKNKRICKTLLIIIASSTIFEVSPTCLSLFFAVVLHIPLNSIIGPFEPTFTSINITICAYLYSKTFREAFKIYSSNEIRVVIDSS